MAELYEALLTQGQGREPKTLSERLKGDVRGSTPKRRRTVAQIINETESQRPLSRQGNGDDCWPPLRGPPHILRLKRVLAITSILETQLLDAVAKGFFRGPLSFWKSAARLVGLLRKWPSI
jgi:hypothetical protein